MYAYRQGRAGGGRELKGGGGGGGGEGEDAVEAKSFCTEMPSEHDFNPVPFETKALGHTKVGLSWDEEDKDDRLQLTKRKFGKQELEHMDYSAYLASDTDDSLSDDDDDNAAGGSAGAGARSGMAALLAECREAEEAEMPHENMEITWDLGLKERTEEALKRREDRLAEAGMTLGEKHEKKQKDKKKARKQLIKERIAASKAGDGGNAIDGSSDEEDMAARAGGDDAYFKQDLGDDFAPRGGGKIQSAIASSGDDDDDDDDASDDASDGGIGATELAAAAGDAEAGDGHFDMRKIAKEHKMSKKKGKKKGKNKRGNSGDVDEDTEKSAADKFTLDVADSRFGAVFDNKDFTIDPTRPEFKDTREMQRLIDERQSRLRKKEAEKGKKRKSKKSEKSGKGGGRGASGYTAPADQDGILAELVASVKDNYAKGGPKNKRFKGRDGDGDGRSR